MAGQGGAGNAVTALYRLQLDGVFTAVPMVGFSVEAIQYSFRCKRTPAGTATRKGQDE